MDLKNFAHDPQTRHLVILHKLLLQMTPDIAHYEFISGQNLIRPN